MIEDNKMGRRLTDLSGSSDFVNLMMEMQQTNSNIKNVAEKVQGLPELTKKVEALVAQMNVIAEEVDAIDKIKELVGWHERLWKLISTVCILLFPTLLASVFWIWTQVSEIRNTQDIHEFKLQYMEKLNERAIKSTDTNKGIDELAWHLWDFDSSRTWEILFHRTSLAGEQVECELYSYRNLQVQL